MISWLNGQMHSDIAQISSADRGFLLADGIFETILVKNRTAVFFQEHFTRLQASAFALDISIPYSEDVIRRTLSEMFLSIGAEDEGILRITLSRGQGSRGLLPPLPEKASPTLLMTLTKKPTEPKASKALCLYISDVRRNEGSPMSRLKSLAYSDNILAKRQASDHGADEALMLNNQEQICCASIGNIFLITEGGELQTPDISSGILSGIIRSKILLLASELAIPVVEKKFYVDDLKDKFLFMTNSLMGLRKVFISGENADRENTVFQKLSAAYTSCLLKDIKS